MFNKNGQAAMEFLMTYGWAILVVLIAIGALAYFGVLSPQKFLPQSCTLSPGFACSDFAIYNPEPATSDDLVLIVRNGIGATANLACAGCGLTIPTVINGATSCGPGNRAGYIVPTQITEGATATFEFECPGVDTKGNRFKAPLQMIYQLSGQTLTHTITGDMTTRIE